MISRRRPPRAPPHHPRGPRAPVAPPRAPHLHLARAAPCAERVWAARGGADRAGRSRATVVPPDARRSVAASRDPRARAWRQGRRRSRSVPFGVDHVPAAAEVVDALAPGLAGGLVTREVVQRVPVVGDLAARRPARASYRPAGLAPHPRARQRTRERGTAATPGRTAPVSASRVTPGSASNRYSCAARAVDQRGAGRQRRRPDPGESCRGGARRGRHRGCGRQSRERDAERRPAAGQDGGGEHAAQDAGCVAWRCLRVRLPLISVVGGRGRGRPTTALHAQPGTAPAFSSHELNAGVTTTRY